MPGLVAALVATGLSLAPPPRLPTRGNIRVRSICDADMRAVTEMRTEVFSSHLTSEWSKHLQGKMWEEAMANKTAVLVAYADGELAGALSAVESSSTSSPHAGRHRIVGAKARAAKPILGTGDMLLVPVPNALAHGSCCYVTNVCVDPRTRRCGVARRLMHAIDLRASALAATALVLHVDASNVAAVGLYESMGFVDSADAAVKAAFDRPPFIDVTEEDFEPQRLMIKPISEVAPRLGGDSDSRPTEIDPFATRE